MCSTAVRMHHITFVLPPSKLFFPVQSQQYPSPGIVAFDSCRVGLIARLDSLARSLADWLRL